MDRRDVLALVGWGVAASSLPSCATTAGAGRATGKPLWAWSAVELRDGFAKGDISASDVTRSVLDRLDAVNPTVNAVVANLGQEALTAAREADKLRASGKALPPLHGIPVTIKVNTDYKGQATTNGVVAFKNNIAPADAAVVQNLRRNGAIVVGMTNVPAFSYRWFSNNDLHGATYNPWDPAITPGGSSGGAAVATAVGIGALGHGTDIAGSVRYPAFVCGVAGIRPTPGTVPAFNPSQPQSARTMMSQLMSVQGLMARSVADLRYAFPSLSEVDPRDPSSTPVARSDRPLDRKPKVAVMLGHPAYSADAEVSASLQRAMNAAKAAGCEVEEAIPPSFAELADLWSSLTMAEVRRNFLPLIEKSGDRLIQTFARDWVSITPDLDIDGYINGLARRERMMREWRLFLNQYDALILPSSWMNPFAFDLDQRGLDTVRKIIKAQSPQLAVAIAGVPGLSVPTGNINGVPTGVQVVADRFREDKCFLVGELLERQLGVFTPIDPRPSRKG